MHASNGIIFYFYQGKIFIYRPFSHPLLLFIYLAEDFEHCGSFKNSETPRVDKSEEASSEERAVFMSNPLSNSQEFSENSTRKNNINMISKTKMNYQYKPIL